MLGYILSNGFDKVKESRGLKFVRYADGMQIQPIVGASSLNLGETNGADPHARCCESGPEQPGLFLNHIAI